MFVDKHGKPLFHGAYVHFKRDPFNPNAYTAGIPEEIDGWLLCEDNEVRLYMNDRENHLVFTGMYWELDNDPMWEIELA